MGADSVTALETGNREFDGSAFDAQLPAITQKESTVNAPPYPKMGLPSAVTPFGSALDLGRASDPQDTDDTAGRKTTASITQPPLAGSLVKARLGEDGLENPF